LVDDLQRQFNRGARLEVDTLTHFLAKRKASQAPELREIVRVVSRYYQVPLKLLTSASRQAGVVGARATAIYLARTLTDSSYGQIGQHLGGRDHTTIMHSHRQIERRLGRETALRSAIEDLTRLLRK
jgi:chromosomal replication initiator protein